MENVYLTLVNRSSKDLVGRYDGKQHILPAGSKTSWPEHLALKFKEQNPVMGSENYYTGEKQYLLAIEEYGDPTEPIEQSDAHTLWQLSQIPVPAGVKLETIKGYGFNPFKDKQPGLPAQVVGFEPNKLPASAGPAEKVVLDGADPSVAEKIFEKP